MQRLVEGFFATWAMFVVDSPFPESGRLMRIENSGEDYRVFNTLESGDVTFTMTSDFVITEWIFTGPRGKRVVKPLFHKAADGFLLSGYQSTFESINDGIKTTLEFHIEYRDVSGLKLPHQILMSGMYASEPVEAELIFDKFVLNPH
jgi:hypothetical protein